MALEPDDLIFTGTPTGCWLNFMGDHIQVSIKGELLLGFKID